MIATQVPNSQAPIYLPMIVKGTPNDITEVEATLVVTIDTNDYTLKSEFYNGVAFFDIAPLIHEHFANTRVDVGAPTGYIFSDRELYVPYTLDGGDGWTETGNFVGWNSNVGITKIFLTGFARLKKYLNYPLSLCFIGNNNDAIINVADGIADNYVLTCQDKIIVDIILTDEGEVTINQSVSHYIDNYCTPASPFYVRWINRFGGYDYWMFEKRQITNSELDGIETFNQYTELGTFEKQINSKAKETITVGAENITNADYNEVYQLAYSPRIEHWNGTSWDALVIDKMKAEFDSGETRQAVEFTFNLPTRQMQW